MFLHLSVILFTGVACMARGMPGRGLWQEGVCGRLGHAWKEGMHGGGIHAGETATETGGTHPTGMHS